MRQMPLTLYLVTAGVIIWLYLQRASARAAAAPAKPAVRQPTVRVPPTLPPVGGIDWSKRG